MTRTHTSVFPGAWPERMTFSPAVVADNFVFVSGTTASNNEGVMVAPGDIVGQTRFIYEKIERVLIAAGGTLANIVETTDYFVTLEDYAKTAAVRRQVFKGGPYPAATGVMVAGLIRPEALIEIKAVALLGAART